MKKLREKKLEKMTFQDVVQKFASGQTLQDQLGITDETMQKYYEASMSYVADQQYKEASDCFLFMLALNPMESNLWIQAGKAAQCLHEYDEALQAFSMAMIFDADDPFPHLYSAEIYKQKNEIESAEKCREIAMRLIDENPGYAPLKELVASF